MTPRQRAYLAGLIDGEGYIGVTRSRGKIGKMCKAASVLRELKPYLIVKAEQADVALRFQAAMRFPGCAGLRDDEWDLREECYRRTKELNYGTTSHSVP